MLLLVLGTEVFEYARCLVDTDYLHKHNSVMQLQIQINLDAQVTSRDLKNGIEKIFSSIGASRNISDTDLKTEIII
jgi:hypothetical protein